MIHQIVKTKKIDIARHKAYNGGMVGDGWLKRLAEWDSQNQDINISVPFTWLLPAAALRCERLTNLGYRVRVGGPAVALRPDYIRCGEIGGQVDALPHHNPNATFTSRGCIRQCSFCAVPRIEGDLRELPEWSPRPIICDNNLLACSVRHFDRVIDSLKGLKRVDFNQGLDARLLTPHHVGRLKELDLYAVRFSWDSMADEPYIMDAIAQFPKRRVRVYVLIGWEDSPDDALYRLESIRARGIRPNAMRFQPLTTLKKDSYVAPGWTQSELRRFTRYWNRLRWMEHIPFAEYNGGLTQASD